MFSSWHDTTVPPDPYYSVNGKSLEVFFCWHNMFCYKIFQTQSVRLVELTTYLPIMRLWRFMFFKDINSSMLFRLKFQSTFSCMFLLPKMYKNCTYIFLCFKNKIMLTHNIKWVRQVDKLIGFVNYKDATCILIVNVKDII